MPNGFPSSGKGHCWMARRLLNVSNAMRFRHPGVGHKQSRTTSTCSLTLSHYSYQSTSLSSRRFIQKDGKNRLFDPARALGEKTISSTVFHSVKFNGDTIYLWKSTLGSGFPFFLFKIGGEDTISQSWREKKNPNEIKVKKLSLQPEFFFWNVKTTFHWNITAVTIFFFKKEKPLIRKISKSV